VGAPVVEEAAKATALLLVLALRPDALDDVAGGLLVGAFAGLGFALSENLGYFTLAAVQGGPSGLLRATWVRGLLQGFDHAIFTATTGAAIGWGRRRARGVGVAVRGVAGLAVAIAQHAVWNAVGSRAVTAVLCNAAAPGGACREPPPAPRLLASVALVVAASIGPGVLVLLALLRRARN
jgi:RsiW-degrading membrane proteinase PrsW (M82 family)